MKAMLVGSAAAALITFGALTASATAAGVRCSGTSAATSIALADETAKVACVGREAPAGEPTFREAFDPTDVASIQAVARELGIDLDFAAASRLSKLLAGAALSQGDDALPPELAELLNRFSALTGDKRDGVLGELARQLAEIVRTLGIDDPGGSGARAVPLAGHETTANAPELPYKDDPSLYGMTDGKLDESDDPPDEPASEPDEWNPYPGGSSGEPSDTPLAEPSPPPLVEAERPSLTPDDSPSPDGGPTDTSGSSGDGNTGGSSPLDGPFAKSLKSNLEHFTIPLSVKQEKQGGPSDPPSSDDWKRPGTHFHYTDPDSAGQEAGTPTREQLEEVVARLNELKDTVRPDTDTGDEIAPSSMPEGGANGDPTRELYDGEAPVSIAIGTGETAETRTTAPIDYAQDRERIPVETAAGDVDADTTHVVH
jgi:hypothetical protein